MTTDKIYLVGFMGAGKTTLARDLGQRLDWRVEDVDARIEARERTSIADIFALRGEPYFREVERQVVRDLIPLRHTVVATGGGTFLDPDSRALIKSDGMVFWIDVPLVELVTRIPQDGSRPLASTLAQLDHLYLIRRAAYEDAHVRLDASNRPAGSIVDEIVERLDA